MKKKYQITLVVIGCLIALLGLSYAYFAATNTGGGKGGSTTVETVTLDEVGFNIEGMLEFNDLDIYPGHKNISKIKVTALGNNDTINYKLVWEGINTLNTPLRYYVYKTTTNEEPSITCKKEIEQVGTSKYYYETCTNNSFDNLGTIVNQGEITKTTEKQEFILSPDEVIKGTKEGNVIYYYVVLEYPNLEESQNIDMGGKFEGIVTVKKESDLLADITIKKMYKQNENGYEEITSMPDNSYVLNEERSTCTNNAIPTLKNNKILVTNLNTSGTECNIYFDKDNIAPTITKVINTVTENSITVIVEATDNVGVTEYWYAIDSDNFTKGDSDTKTFTDLGIGSTHTIKVYVKDSSGNQSDTTTREIQTTPDTTIPVITDVSTTTTKTEITVTVSAHDNNGTIKTGVAEYWYQIDSDTPVQKTTNTHIFTGLSAGSTHTIKVYVKDGGGNQSDTTTKNITTTKPTANETILNNITVNSGTPNFSQVATTDEGVYSVSDGMYGGTSYYWRGAATTNYVKFANFCWRIIRINGDGTIRLIYDGSTCHVNGTITSDSIAKKNIQYNLNYDQSNYVGWTYIGISQRTTNGTSSNAKKELEEWYSSNIIGTNASKVVQGKYCNDRDVQIGSTWTIKPSSTLYYAGYKRIYKNYSPTLSCPLGDIYTLSVGLITADEVMYAGGTNTSNSSYYLYNGQAYWTMSPLWCYSGGSAYVFFVGSCLAGDGTHGVNNTYGLRPVINLRSDVTFSGGIGTQSNPYVVS